MAIRESSLETISNIATSDFVRAVTSTGASRKVTVANLTNTISNNLPTASTSAKGVMSASDKTKLDGIETGAEVNVKSNWTEVDSTSDAFILNKPTLATVATSGSYNDLSDKPTINNATLTIKKNGTTVTTFTANSGTDREADISVPTATSDLFNDSGFVTSSDIPQEYDFTTSLTASIDSRGASAKYFNVTPTDSSKLTVANAAKLKAYLVDGSVAYPLLVTYASVSSTYFYTHLKSLFGVPQSTTATTISGTLHIISPFEISNVTAAGM